VGALELLVRGALSVAVQQGKGHDIRIRVLAVRTQEGFAHGHCHGQSGGRHVLAIDMGATRTGGAFQETLGGATAVV